MKNSIVCFAFLVAILVIPAIADDGEWGTESDPCIIDWIGSGTELELIHVDADPWKGWGKLWLKNWCGGEWGDFHLKVLGYNSLNVDFIDGEIDSVNYDPQLWVFAGGNWEQYDIDWTISSDGSQMDITFYDNPIQHGELAWIKAYTDNTSRCSFFTIKAYPTPVPEPATIALLGLGALAILRKK